jgi:hypothetical protein
VIAIQTKNVNTLRPHTTGTKTEEMRSPNS